MDSVFEVQRQTHEEIERFEKAVTIVLAKPQPTHREKLRNEHAASQILDRISTRFVTLNNLYGDTERRQAEVQSISAPAQQHDLSEFNQRLAKIEEHHRKYPDSGAGGFELELAGLLADPEEGDEDEYEEEDPVSLMFSGEEGGGRYLDLYANHNMYNNLKDIGKRLPYIHYLDKLLAVESGLVHHDLSKEVRLTKEYETYIMTLHSYLMSYTKRAEPLVDVVGIQRNSEAEFNQLWQDDVIPGWEQRSAANPPPGDNVSGEEIWCSACQKKYSKKTVYDAHLTSKKHIKAAARETEFGPGTENGGGAKTIASGTASTRASRTRNSALYTFLATSLLHHHSITLVETKSNVERRFALTAREREQELIEKPSPAPMPNASGEGAPEEEEEERIYNPLKLPLGWDGKPIPYWLYKLHGLGVEYRCEICSDHVYMGRKNFERHFQESRHAFGMRALGLPNTKHFHEITRIEDALSLAEKLKQEGRQEITENETMEELEDDDGNVYNRKTFEDLKKQGII